MFEGWPWWAIPLVRSAVTILVAVGLGHVVRAVFRARMARMAAKSAVQWDDILVAL